MTGARAALAAVLLPLAVVVQVSVLGQLPLPGATPDLVLVVVVALALGCGGGSGAVGAVLGFAAGLCLDLAPPADHPVGLWAFVLTLVGFVAAELGPAAPVGGGLDPVMPPRALGPLAVVGLTAAAAAGATLLAAALTTVVGGGRVAAEVAWGLVPTAALYAGLLATFVVPGVSALLRRLAPEPEIIEGVSR
jgi:hypothetical protein